MSEITDLPQSGINTLNESSIHAIKTLTRIKEFLNAPIPNPEELKQLEQELEEKAKQTFAKENPFQSVISEYFNTKFLSNRETKFISYDPKYVNAGVIYTDIMNCIVYSDIMLTLTKSNMDLDKVKDSINSVADSIVRILNLDVDVSTEWKHCQTDYIEAVLRKIIKYCRKNSILPTNDKDYENPNAVLQT